MNQTVCRILKNILRNYRKKFFALDQNKSATKLYVHHNTNSPFRLFSKHVGTRDSSRHSTIRINIILTILCCVQYTQSLTMLHYIPSFHNALPEFKLSREPVSSFLFVIK